MLRCIRCGACMNHCPVYQAVGGHAYGWVYPGPDGRGADAVADRRRRGRATAQRLDLLRPLRGGLPGAHPAAEDDAALARARVRARAVAGAAARRASASGRSSPAGRRSIASRPTSSRGRSTSSGAARAGSRALPLAGGWTQLPRPRRARAGDVPEPVARQERSGEMSARDGDSRQHPALARRDRERRRRADSRSSGGSPRRPRASCRSAGRAIPRRASPTFRAEAERAQASVAEVASLADVPAEVARFLRDANCPATLRDGRRPAPRRHAVGRDGARDRCIGAVGRPRPQRGLDGASPGSPRPGRSRSSRAPTIRRRSTSCPTTTSSC